MPSYEIEFYQTSSGRSPVEDFLRDLKRKRPKAWTKCMYSIELLHNEGPNLVMKHQYAEKVEDNLYTLRIAWDRVEYRLFYTWDNREHQFVVVDAITKKTVELTEHDKRRARKRVQEVLNG